MRATVPEAVDDIGVVDDVEIDKPGEGEVLVRVEHEFPTTRRSRSRR